MRITITDENRALYQTRLLEAETAHHKLMMGGAAQTVTYNGETLTKSQANLEMLERYIGNLQAALNPSQRQRPGARRVVFGCS